VSRCIEHAVDLGKVWPAPKRAEPQQGCRQNCDDRFSRRVFLAGCGVENKLRPCAHAAARRKVRHPTNQMAAENCGVKSAALGGTVQPRTKRALRHPIVDRGSIWQTCFPFLLAPDMNHDPSACSLARKRS